MQISETAQKIISLLAVKPNLQARDISFELVIPRKIIIEALQGELSQYVHCSETSHWALRPEVALDSSAERAAAGAADGSVQPTAAGTSSTNFAFGSLEAVRRKLLDLSGRNALLHYKHPKNNCVRLIDEMPDQIFTELSNDRLFCLIPVPSPTERQLIDAQYIEYDPATNAVIKQTYPTAAEWAKRLGLSTNFDLPEKNAANVELASHQDNDLQTLLFAPELEARLRSIKSKADIALQEVGANVLYLVLGFLEWYETDTSELPRLAPLFTVPVQLEKATLDSREGVYSYTLRQKDDGFLTNVTLREKLKIDFSLDLPFIEDEQLPEEYLERITQVIIKHKPRWKIKRQATLALLDFAKQAMYEDLNPEKWPSRNNIVDHALIRQFFSSAPIEGDGSASGYAGEHAIDSIDTIHQQFPLIYEADSSQHSAIIDAASGQNLVIEGPPGTGKSQTITNLIAAAIANGKRVLFVAEKMAALEVVKSRLDKAGLGDFCLELHSHKSNKLQVLNDIHNRLLSQDTYTTPREIATGIARYESLKSSLSRYVEFINAPWKQTGLTLHQILNGAVRYREALKTPIEDLNIAALNGAELTPIRFRELIDNTQMLANVYQQVAAQAPQGDIARHYWYGVNKFELAAFEHRELTQLLKAWNDDLHALMQSWGQLMLPTEPTPEADTQFTTLMPVAQCLAELPNLTGKEPLALLPLAAQQPDLFDECVAEYKAIYTDCQTVEQAFKTELFTNSVQLPLLSAALTELVNLGLTEQCTLSQLQIDLERLNKLLPVLSQLQSHLALISSRLPAVLGQRLVFTFAGLKEFVTLVNLVNQLPSDLWRYVHAVYDHIDFDQGLAQLTPWLDKFIPLHGQLNDQFNLAQLPSTQQLKNIKTVLDGGGLFSFLSSQWRQARKQLVGLANTAKPQPKALHALLGQAIEYRGCLDAINSVLAEHGFLNEVYAGVNTPVERISMLRTWYKAVRAEYGVGFGERVALGDALFALDRTLIAALGDAVVIQQVSVATAVLSTAKDYLARFQHLKPSLTPHGELLGEQCGFKLLQNVLHINLNTLRPWVTDGNRPAQTLLNDLNLFAAMAERTSRWRATAFYPLLPTEFNIQLPDYYSENCYQALNNCRVIVDKLMRVNTQLNLLAQPLTEGRYGEIKRLAHSIFGQLAAANVSQEKFAAFGAVNMDEWCETCGGYLGALIERNKTALSEPLWLPTWLDYKRVRSRLIAQGLGALVNNLENLKITPDSLLVVLKHVFFSQLAKEAYSECDFLREFSGLEQTAIREQFRLYDKELLTLQRQAIAYAASRRDIPAGNNRGRVSEYTETALIAHEAGKKTRHIPVRALLKRAKESIVSLKPCFMMSPMSVAQYLTPGQFDFDIVVMDEASQIRPEDALGAIARGKSMVVVGDPKQLPPTAFFQRALNDDDINEEAVAAENSESILETAMPMFKTRRLRWHYRSRHESLIAFSNQQFYDNNLVIFPSPFQNSSEFGVALHRVATGTFVTRRNSQEAKHIVAMLTDLLKTQPGYSLGVVAMSAEQKNEIEIQFEQAVKMDHELALAYEHDKSKPESLFIKNLENVQGDERDIILISMTYGPEQIGGRTMQRFGPINSDAGGRRLNVLFTRAKKQMHIFSSMGSSDVLVSNTSKKGVRALRAFLEYCESHHLHSTNITAREPDSDFEISVIEELAKHGYQCEPQLGIAGYFLDIAVRDPGNSGRFLIGIECDGATYHSAKSARDRDRLRQEILEGLGWRIRRIWSTDWFSNPQAQLTPILEELNALRSFSNGEELLDIVVSTDEILDELAEDIAVEPEIQNIELPTDDSQTLTLKQKLINFNECVIRKYHPEVNEQVRLLRPAMVEALINYLPTTKAEFAELIPPYLRLATHPEEGVYLDQVLELIRDN